MTRPRTYRDDDRYCFYCGKQYATNGTFKRHIITAHGLGLAARLRLLTPEEEAERQRLMAEAGEQDGP
jgi:hypothetical protein